MGSATEAIIAVILAAIFGTVVWLKVSQDKAADAATAAAAEKDKASAELQAQVSAANDKAKQELQDEKTAVLAIKDPAERLEAAIKLLASLRGVH